MAFVPRPWCLAFGHAADVLKGLLDVSFFQIFGHLVITAGETQPGRTWEPPDVDVPGGPFKGHPKLHDLWMGCHCYSHWGQDELSCAHHFGQEFTNLLKQELYILSLCVSSSPIQHLCEMLFFSNYHNHLSTNSQGREPPIRSSTNFKWWSPMTTNSLRLTHPG